MATSLEVFVVVAGVFGGFASCCCFVLFLCLFAVVAFLGCLICLISLGCFVVVCLFIYIYIHLTFSTKTFPMRISWLSPRKGNGTSG